MRKLLTLTLILCVCSITLGQQIGMRYTDVYRWHGWPIYEENIIHSSVNAEIQGIDIEAISHFENEDNDLKKWDTTLGYQLPVENLIIKPSYGYIFLPGMDAQELGLTFGLPGAIAPRYSIYQVVPDNSANGQIHVLGVDVLLGGGDPNAISANLMAELTYNDGVNPFGQKVIRDFTHISVAAQLNIPMDAVILQPGVIYQRTLEDELLGENTNDFWYTIGIEYRF